MTLRYDDLATNVDDSFTLFLVVQSLTFGNQSGFGGSIVVSL